MALTLPYGKSDWKELACTVILGCGYQIGTWELYTKYHLKLHSV